MERCRPSDNEIMTDSQAVTDFMKKFWGKKYNVSDCPLTPEKLKIEYNNCRIPIFIPPGLFLARLPVMFPEIRFGHKTPVESVKSDYNSAGWFLVENTLEPPYLNLEEHEFKGAIAGTGKRGQSLLTYAVWGVIYKQMFRNYPDSGNTTSVLTGSKIEGAIITAAFDSQGYLITSVAGKLSRSPTSGFRTEEVIS